ncbi:hypothetical protein THAOC_12331, partial [Thalassiosira oceanica]
SKYSCTYTHTHTHTHTHLRALSLGMTIVGCLSQLNNFNVLQHSKRP